VEKEPKKASEVLVELNSKIDDLLRTVGSLDLKMGIISNKLNELLKVGAVPAQPNKIVIEAVNTIPKSIINSTFDPNKQIPISSEQKLPEETSPVGFRRTSRPETFAGDDAYINQPKKKDNTPRFPIQVPKSDGQSEVIIPKAVKEEIKVDESKQKKPHMLTTSVPTMQRVVDRNGKSVFLADVEILDFETSDQIVTTRTNGTGKWQAALHLGKYKVIVRKRESLTKEKVETVQSIVVDGTQSPLELSTMIIK
jgi:hypothetical protein